MSDKPNVITEGDGADAKLLEHSLQFDEGLPGFREFRRFILTQTDKEKPFAWLRSLDDESLAFPVIEAFHLLPDYEVDVDDQDLKSLGEPSVQDCSLMLVLKVDVDESVKIQTNLRAPIVINTRERCAKQVIARNAEDFPELQHFEFPLPA